MKKFIIGSLLFAGIALSQNANAQLSISINIGSQPAWGPVGYDYVRYYYLPEVNVYYDVNAARFIYPSGNRWLYASTLPRQYGRIDLYNTYKVVVNRNYAPYRDNRSDVAKYSRYRTVHNQVVIRDSRDWKYYESRYHPQHDKWVTQSRKNDRSDIVRNNRNDSRRDRNGARR